MEILRGPRGARNGTCMNMRRDCLIIQGFPGGSDGKESACSAGDTGDAGSIPGLGRSPRVGNGNPLQYFCLGNPMDRGAW